jgi:hypothetical protein
MKFFVCILSIYILVLTAIPCIDKPDDHRFAKNEKTSCTNSHQQHEGNQCSPFCTCNCCVTPVIYQDLVISFDSFSYVEKNFFSHYKSAIFSFHLSSIWQPPQIA